MTGLDGSPLGLEIVSLDPAGDKCPASQASISCVTGSIQSLDAIKQLESCDVVTFEIEHVNATELAELEATSPVWANKVRPSAKVVSIIQDKFRQKEHFAASEHDIPLAPYMNTPNLRAIQDAIGTYGLPLMVKSRKNAYDGKGNAVLKTSDVVDIQKILDNFGGDDSCYVEKMVDFAQEVAVMVVRSCDDKIPVKSYPAVTAIQRDSICRVVLVPARGVSKAVRTECERVARAAISSLGVLGASGVFGVELFVTRDDKVYLNEVAPRPHNTGHYTQDACVCSQFENHLRAITGLPLGNTELICNSAAMVNVLGAADGTVESTMKSIVKSYEMPNARVHWYGKAGVRAGRKMGHINIVGDCEETVTADVEALLEAQGMKPVVNDSKVGGDVLPPGPLVGVIMGSDSDLPCMTPAIDMLKHFGIPYEVDIVSAHRTPEKMLSYGKSAHGRGLECIIAGAGGAAHLPGMVASLTPLPVVGVPVKTSSLSGVDSLYSIVQMPGGIPCATVGIGNAKNAGLLAARIVGSTRPRIREKMLQYQEGLKNMVAGKSEKMLEIGADEYLRGMENKSGTVNV